MAMTLATLGIFKLQFFALSPGGDQMIAGEWGGEIRRRAPAQNQPGKAQFKETEPGTRVKFNFDHGRMTGPWLVAIGVVLRLLIGLCPYSGEGQAPQFGDFEAQRHWMEVTLHLPVQQWYVNDEQRNPLSWWGLDYPPLSAYFARLLGWISARYFDPRWTALVSSRGMEEPGLRLFMRLSVLAVDLVVLMPALFWFWQGRRQRLTASLWLPLLCCPLLLLIDHGHFQYFNSSLFRYNNAMLGLIVMAATALIDHRAYRLAAVLVTLAVMFKQTALYFCPAFAMGLLRACLHRGVRRGGLLFVQLLVVGLGAAALLLWPFWRNFPTHLLPLITRVFPVGRGLFQDKVSNWWWVWAQLTKAHRGHSHETLFRWCALATGLAQLPMAVSLLAMRPLKSRFLYALAYSSLSCFLLSYHVHEKGIMLPCLAVLLLVGESPALVCCFTLLALFSLSPLLVEKDGLALPYALGLLGWSLYWRRLLPWERIGGGFKAALSLLSLVIAGVHVGQMFYLPPAHLPHLWPTIVCLLSAGGFSIAWLYLLWQMLTVTEESHAKTE